MITGLTQVAFNSSFESLILLGLLLKQNSTEPSGVGLRIW